MRSASAPVRNALDHLRHGDFAVFLEGVHHQAIAADVVDALPGGGGGGVGRVWGRGGATQKTSV